MSRVARLFVPPALLDGEQAVLTNEPHRYLSRVLRLHVGDKVTVFDGAGTEVAAVIERSDAKSTVLALGQRRSNLVATRPIELMLAVPKGDRMDWAVQKATELGVARITPVISARTVMHSPGGPTGKSKRWQTIAREAARQCGRADVPAVAAPCDLDEALRTLGAAVTAPGSVRLLAWEEETALPLRRALRGDETGVILLVGAEGGFAAAEVAAARAAGFVSVGLGARILRSETAALVAVTLVQAALGALD